MSFQDDTVDEIPNPRRRHVPASWSIPHEPAHRPWFNPPDVTPEMEELAEAWDAGGPDLIREVEYGIVIVRGRPLEFEEL